MKLLSSFALVVLGLAVVPTVHAQKFEGLIVYRIESPAGVIQQKSWVRGDSVVIEAEAPMPALSFANFASQEFKVYQGQTPQVMPLKDFEADHEKTKNLQPQPQRQSVDGKTAQLYIVEVPTSDRKTITTSFWLTKEFPTRVGKAITRNLLIGTSGDPIFRDIATEILDLGMAPVKLSVSINGKENMSMQIVAATEQSIPLEKFDLK
jgi:hypothetical protein